MDGATQTTNLQQQKQALRAKVRGIQLAEPQDCAALGVMMAVRVTARPEWVLARRVFLFLGAGQEPDTLPLVRAAFAAGKQVFVPRITGPGQMDAAGLTDLAQLRPGPYGIMTVGAKAPVCPPERIQLAILPCLAASPQGARLGHGAGYYDRWLAGCPGCKLLLCPEHLLFREIPTGPQDIRADLVVTERRCLCAR